MVTATVDYDLKLSKKKTSRSVTDRDLEVGLYGGAERVRTADLRLAKPALSQLSYSPEPRGPEPWWAWVDLNYRPPAYQADALTN